MATVIGKRVQKERRAQQVELAKKAVATSHTATLFHGTGGLFSDAALERQVISAIDRPIAGIGSLMPVRGSMSAVTEFAALSGFTTTGSEPSTPCADAPTGSYSKCQLQVHYGLKSADTLTEELGTVAMNANRGDMRDFQLLGTLIGRMPGFEPGAGINQEQLINMVKASEMVAVAMQLEDHVIDATWQGDPSNNVGTGYAEPEGLDIQITTGIQDAVSSEACPALDSVVRDFDFGMVAGGAGAGGTEPSETLYQSLKRAELDVYLRRRRTGLGRGESVIAMPPELWYHVSEVLPCQAASEGCRTTLNSGETLYIDAGTMREDTERMREDMTITINGRTYSVVEDDGIELLDNTTNPADIALGNYASMIAFVPLTVLGNFPVLYYEHYDYRVALLEFARDNFEGFVWSDDGRFAWAHEFVNFCLKTKGKVQFRPVLRTPHLAFKIQNIQWSNG